MLSNKVSKNKYVPIKFYMFFRRTVLLVVTVTVVVLISLTKSLLNLKIGKTSYLQAKKEMKERETILETRH